MEEVLKEITEKNPKLAWLESEKARESWSIYIEPNEATDARFRSLKNYSPNTATNSASSKTEEPTTSAGKSISNNPSTSTN